MIKVLIPSYYRHRQLYDCLNSIYENTKDWTDIQIYLYDNASDTETIQTIRKFKSILYYIEYGNVNIGKAKALNRFIEFISDDDYVISLDGDLILHKPDMDFFHKLTEKFKDTPECSIAVTQQETNSKHLIEMNWDSRGVYIDNRKGFGIAGGCLITTGSNFKAVGGYRTNRGIFGGNDGYLLYDISSIDPSKGVGVFRDFAVIHPSDEDMGYKEWKDKAQEQQIKHNRCLEYKGYYDE